jgi:glycosyltransferase involved in cell wall biosynthesis
MTGTAIAATAVPDNATGHDSAYARQLARRRICIVSDDLSGAPDEGIKKFAVALAGAMRGQHEVAVISTRGPATIPGVQFVPAPRSFVGRQLRAALRRQRPDVLIYAARGSATFFSFLRSRLLKAYCSGAQVVLLGLQTRRHGTLQRQLIRWLRPDLVGVQAAANGTYLAGLGCRTVVLPSGVDLATFRPVDEAERLALRARYGLRADMPVVFHVGHLETGRNIRYLGDLAARGDCQVVLVTSSSTAFQAEQDLGQELRRAGVILLTDYQPRIEQLHQLADCYLFPVESTDNAIDVPLSVLEALACDVPVVATRYGGLPQLFADQAHPALVFVQTPATLVEEAARLAHAGVRGGRSLVEPYSWERIADELLAGLDAGRLARD